MWCTTSVLLSILSRLHSINKSIGSRVTDGGAKEVNFVGNLYKQGPASELTYDLKATVSDLSRT